jgi:RNA polymerase sigma-70 factor (ECF subfamily)
VKGLADPRHTPPEDGNPPAQPPHLDAARLFRDHAQFVASFVVRLGMRREEVDDIVQEVFLVAHRRGGFIPGAARPTTWLAEIALRVSSSARRRQRRSREDPDVQTIAGSMSPARGPGEQAEAAEALRRVQQTLEALDEAKRAVFILFELEGESCESIAAGLGIPVGTVYSRLHKARKLFMEVHARLLGGPKLPGPASDPPPHGPSGLPPHGPSGLPPHGPSGLPPHGPSGLPPHGPSGLPPHGPAGLQRSGPTGLDLPGSESRDLPGPGRKRNSHMVTQ